MTRIIIFFLVLINYLYGINNPNLWPWRGVNIPIDILEREKDVVKELSRINVNAVRIHVNYKKLMKKYHLDANETIKMSISMTGELLDQLADNNMTAMLGIENVPQENPKCKNKLSPVFWKTQSCIDKMYSVAEKLTSHFKGRGSELSAYQFISEPVVVINSQSKRPKNWVEIQNKLLKIVDKNDPNRFFVITPGPWGMPQGYKNFKPLPSDKVIYNAHFFQPQQYTHQGIKNRDFPVEYPSWIRFRHWDKDKLENMSADLKKFQNKYDVPVLIGSFSKMNWIKDNNQWLKDSLDIFEKNGWGWSYFIVGASPWYGWDPRYEGNYKTKKFVLKDDTETWKLLKKYFRKNNILDKK